MKYTIIESQGQKWLRPIDVAYPNEDHQDEEGIFQLADTVLYKQMTADLPYIGTREVGASVDESEVKEVRQHRHKDDPKNAFFSLNNETLWLWQHREEHRDIEFRTAYTDVEPVQSNTNYWMERCEAAEKYIAESPCDPDITSKQKDSHNKWQELVKKEPK